MSVDLSEKRTTTGPRRLNPNVALLLGVFVIPFAIGIACNSWSAPDNAAYIRMAFASVAGCTVAIITVIALLVESLFLRAPVRRVMLFGVIGLVVVTAQISGLSSTSELLLERLDLPN